MKTAFIFAGQGTQYVGMGKSLYEASEDAAELFDNSLGSALKEICFNGPEEALRDTANAQPCIVTCSIAAARELEKRGVKCDYAAGLSLGEYSALAYAKAMTVDDAIDIVKQRGIIMSEALPEGTSAMAAVIGASLDMIEDVICQAGGVLEIANYNSPKQIVITGEAESLDRAIVLFKDRNVRCIKLNVSGAFHCSLLKEAGRKLRKVIDKYELHSPEIPVVFNASGKVEDSNLSEILERQIQSSVKFMQSIEYMIEEGVDTFIEIGPGKVLSGFIRQIDKNVRVFAVDGFDTIERTVELINEQDR